MKCTIKGFGNKQFIGRCISNKKVWVYQDSMSRSPFNAKADAFFKGKKRPSTGKINLFELDINEVNILPLTNIKPRPSNYLLIKNERFVSPTLVWIHEIGFKVLTPTDISELKTIFNLYTSNKSIDIPQSIAMNHKLVRKDNLRLELSKQLENMDKLGVELSKHLNRSHQEIYRQVSNDEFLMGYSFYTKKPGRTDKQLISCFDWCKISMDTDSKFHIYLPKDVLDRMGYTKDRLNIYFSKISSLGFGGVRLEDGLHKVNGSYFKDYYSVEIDGSKHNFYNYFRVVMIRFLLRSTCFKYPLRIINYPGDINNPEKSWEAVKNAINTDSSHIHTQHIVDRDKKIRENLSLEEYRRRVREYSRTKGRFTSLTS